MKHILLVDDESSILDGIRRSLYSDRDRWNMQFVLVGEATLQACAAYNFDVVISDMRMPGVALHLNRGFRVHIFQQLSAIYMQKWQQWESASDADWGLAVEREAVIGPLAAHKRLRTDDVEEAARNLGVVRSVLYKLMRRYARVSTDDQSAALQLAALKRAGRKTLFKG